MSDADTPTEAAVIGTEPRRTTASHHFDAVDHDNHEIRTREHDPLVKRWDHRISIQARGENRAIYRDEIELDAGFLTLPVWAWTSWFYRHRQRRWRALARKL